MRLTILSLCFAVLATGCAPEETLIYCYEGSADARCTSGPDAGIGGPGCEHPVRTEGEPLDPNCNSCVAKICAADPVCCDHAGTWDELCVEAVDDLCVSAGRNACDHSVNETGGPMSPTCGECTANVCAADPVCCDPDGSWDGLCVDAVNDFCDDIGHGGNNGRGGVGPAGLAECNLPDADEHEIQSLYTETDNSIHELIKCGQIQVRLARNLLAVVLMSNRELFNEQTYQELLGYADLLGIDLEIPLERGENGRWIMPIPGTVDSTFAVQFFRPGVADPIKEDPFTLDSYVTGVRVHTTLSLHEMLDDLDRRNVIVFYWDERGPLIDLMNAGRPLANPFVVRVSIADLLELVSPGSYDFGGSGEPEYGPFLSLADAEMTSCVELRDRRSGVDIEYHVDSERDTVAHIAGSSSLFFDVDEIHATSANYELTGDASDLRFEDGDLKGQIDYSITGAEHSVDVVGDYGEGASFGTPIWMCVDDIADTSGNEA